MILRTKRNDILCTHVVYRLWCRNTFLFVHSSVLHGITCIQIQMFKPIRIREIYLNYYKAFYKVILHDITILSTYPFLLINSLILHEWCDYILSFSTSFWNRHRIHYIMHSEHCIMMLSKSFGVDYITLSI
jgi:hypothetical protein